MGLKKYKLGELITQRREKYDGKETLCSWGVSRDGFIRPKQEDADTSIYNVFYRNDFVFNPARMELNSIALNSFCDKAICSSLYEIFYVTREDIVLPEYLNMFIKRDEFARKCWYEAIGSARNYFRVGDLSQFEIALPSIEQQRKYVDVYLALQNNLAAYQSKVEELKLVCDGYIEELRREMPCERIGEYIFRYSEKNTDKAINDVVGLSTEKNFRVAQSRVNRNELGGYKIVHPLDIAYVPTTDTWKVLAFAVNHFEKDVVVSPIYEVFATKGKLKSDYLAVWLKREEFDRYARYNSWGSARENFTFEEMQEIRIPIPDDSVQQAIIDLYLVYEDRKAVAIQLKEQLSKICPVLIRGSLME